MRSTFKVLFYVKKGSEKPNGNLPLMCRITVDGEIKQFSCKMDVPPRLWDVKNNRASGKSVEAQRINLAVDKIRVEVNRRYQELMQTDGYVTAAKLKDAYLGIGIKHACVVNIAGDFALVGALKMGVAGAALATVAVQGILSTFLVRIPVSYAMSKVSGVTLFQIGFATPLATVFGLILSASCVIYYERKRKKA